MEHANTTSIRRPKLLRDQVYEILRDKLLNGTQGGYRIVEEEVAEELGVSRTPVREALRRLELEGLIVASAGRGFEAAPFEYQDIAGALDIRQMLEAYAAREAAKHIAAEEISELEKLCAEEQEKLKKASPDQLHDLFEINRKFHQIIFHAARNRTLIGILSGLPSHSAYSLFALGDMSNRVLFSESHCRLAQAMKAGDSTAAEAEANHHIKLMKEILKVEEKNRA